MKKYLTNEEIGYEKVRVVDEEGKNLGVFSLKEAVKLAKEKNLDLILISEKADPPVCKIADYGKFVYLMEKKEKEKKRESREMKTIRLGYNISLHDFQVRIKQAEKFLKQNHKVKVELILRGREKLFKDLAKKKIEDFFEALKEKIEVEKESEIQFQPKGLILILRPK